MISKIFWILAMVTTRMVQCLSLNSFHNTNHVKIFSSTTLPSIKKFITAVDQPNLLSLNNNLLSSVIYRKSFNTLLKALKTRNSNNPKLRSLKDLSSSLYDDEPHFFCGETLSDAIEYYCVNIKGTSVYGSGSDDDDLNFVIRRIKSKREKTVDEYDHFQGKLFINLRIYKASIA